MEWLISLAIGVLTAAGVYLTLRARTFPVVMGLTMLAYAVNIFLFSMGRLTIGLPAVIDKTAKGMQYSDPLPQALVLTAIVIAFGMTAFLIVLALKARGEMGNDHVDGLEVEEDGILEKIPQSQSARHEHHSNKIDTAPQEANE